MAESIEELSEKIRIPYEVLKETMENYNAYSMNGFDEECFKEKQYLVSVDTPPFVAVKADLGTDGAFGGILVDGQMRALASGYIAGKNA